MNSVAMLHDSLSIFQFSEIDIYCLSYCNSFSSRNYHFWGKLKNKFITTDDTIITRERHRQHLIQCYENLDNFENKKKEEEFDKAAEDLRLAIRHLGIIVGKVDVEEILGSIFNDFCIGK